MTVRSLDGSYLAICPACGYPTWGRGLCAACIAAAPNDGEPTLGVNPGADFGPAAGQAVSHVMRSAVDWPHCSCRGERVGGRTGQRSLLNNQGHHRNSRLAPRGNVTDSSADTSRTVTRSAPPPNPLRRSRLSDKAAVDIAAQTLPRGMDDPSLKKRYSTSPTALG